MGRPDGPGLAAALLLLLALLAGGLVGCYGHQPVPRSAVPAPPRRPPLPPPRSGAYRVRGPAGDEGWERFSVTATAGQWRVESHRAVGAGEEGFALTIDVRSAEPVRFALWRRFDDLVRTVRGERQGRWLIVEASGPGGPGRQRIPYAAGTIIDGPTPTWKALALALLADALEPGRAIAVRTVRFDGPLMAGRVALTTIELRGRRAGRRLVRWARGGEAPAGLWVDDAGWPGRMRVLDPNRQPAWSWRLSEETPGRSRRAPVGASAAARR